MPKHVLPRRAALVALMVGSVVGLTTTVTWGQEKPQIAPEAQNAVQAMGKTLANGGFSFHEQTIREYTDATVSLCISSIPPMWWCVARIGWRWTRPAMMERPRLRTTARH